MKSRINLFLSILITVLSFLFLISCQPDTKNPVGTAINSENSLKGKIDFPDFKIKAVFSDISPRSGVALIYPPGHSTSANKTVVTGLSDLNGNFVLNPVSYFLPSPGEVFILEASKRIGGTGNYLLSIRTYVQWNGNSWDSITSPGIFINTKTTAIATISSLKPSLLSPIETINILPVENGIVQLGRINANVSQALTESVNILVNQALSNNFDPVAMINIDNNGNFVLKSPPTPQSPILSVSKTNIPMGTIVRLSEQRFNISNAGTGILDWEISNNSNWMNINPLKGTNNQDVIITVDPSLVSSGQYSGKLIVSSDAGTETVNVSFTKPNITEPVLAVSANSLELHEISVLKNSEIIITNTGSGTLTWIAKTNQNWLSVSNPEGTGNKTLTVVVDPSLVTVGNYEGKVTIESNSNTEIINVSFTKVNTNNPILYISSSEKNHSFGTITTSRQSTFTITNNGTGLLTWDISTSQNWLTVDNLKGTNNQTVTLTVNPSLVGITGVENNGIITVISNANVGTEIINVSFTKGEAVPSTPQLYISNNDKQALTLNTISNPTQRNISIVNQGGGNLNWKLAKDKDWISLSKTQGENNDTVTITVDPSLVSQAGIIYSGKVYITSEGGADTINVSFTKGEALPDTPKLYISNADKEALTSLNTITEVTQRTISIVNQGGGKLDWFLAKDQSWISLSKTQGENNDTVTITIDPTSLPTKKTPYTGTITVTSKGGDCPIIVSFTK